MPARWPSATVRPLLAGPAAVPVHDDRDGAGTPSGSRGSLGPAPQAARGGPGLNLEDLGFLALQELVDLGHVLVGELLHALLRAVLLVGADLALATAPSGGASRRGARCEPRRGRPRPRWRTTLTRSLRRSSVSCGIGRRMILPSNDGKVIRLPIPQLTEERRKELVKVVRQIAEDGQGRRPQRPPRRDAPPEGAVDERRRRRRRRAPRRGARPEAHRRARRARSTSS